MCRNNKEEFRHTFIEPTPSAKLINQRQFFEGKLTWIELNCLKIEKEMQKKKLDTYKNKIKNRIQEYKNKIENIQSSCVCNNTYELKRHYKYKSNQSCGYYEYEFICSVFCEHREQIKQLEEKLDFIYDNVKEYEELYCEMQMRYEKLLTVKQKRQ